MIFSEQDLSAFLDAELDEIQMQAIREALIEDEALAQRLADLAMVDEQIKQVYSSINNNKVPAEIEALLNIDQVPQSANVYQLSNWFRPASMAASVALVVGLLVGIWLPQKNNLNSAWQAQVQVLDSSLSGEAVIDEQGRTIQPLLSFVNADGNLCRQYQISEPDHSSQHLACRTEQGWRKQLSQFGLAPQVAEEYATASGQTDIMRQAISQMAVGGLLNKTQEAEKLNR
ncbi:anti-sigma factor family protein [Gayadomonas joobiniege]|uniref:anti-sigma factor family protein n=1 Tax=Gayadomonas joobiniege TaxID=1234606 RepID=UPI00035DA14C|nr:hypothetical protein [Gayadomonas joobiniege]